MHPARMFLSSRACPVEASAATAAQAKSMAQNQGRRRAMTLLLRRLTVERDWPSLPHFTATLAPDEELVPDEGLPDEQIMPQGMVFDDNGLRALESGFEIYDEKSSASLYRAFITYRFKPNAVRRLLRDAAHPL